MKAFKKNLNRRDFLECLAVAGFGSAGTISFFPSPMAKAQPNSPNLLKKKQVEALQENRFPVHVFSKHLQFLDYEAMAETAAEAGFDGVDLAVRPKGHVEPERVQQDLPKAIDAIKEKNLLALMMTTAISNPQDPVQQSILKTASILGIKYYRTDWLWYEEQLGIPENLEKFKQQLNALATLNKELNIVGDYQNHAGFNGHPLGGPVWDLALVLNDIDSPFIGCQYDIRHATVDGATSWPLGLQLIHPQINTLVVKDFKWGMVDNKWQIINTPLGEGMVDFPKFFTLVNKYNISAPISLHFEYEMPEHNAKLSIKQKRQETVKVMRKDIETLKKYMKKAGLV